MRKCYQMSSRIFVLSEWRNLLESKGKFWSPWFEVQVNFVTVFACIAALILLLLVSIIMVFFTAMEHYLVFRVFLPVLHTVCIVFTILFDKLPIHEVIYFHFRFWFLLLQSKALVEGNGVMVTVWTVEIFT